MEKRILTDGMRRRLLGFVPFSTNATIPFTPPWPEVPVEFTPIFHIRSFSQEEMLQLKSNYRNLTDKNAAETADLNLNLVRKCVKGWENFFDAGTCEEIAYQSEADLGCCMTIWKSLPSWLLRAIMDEVRKLSGLTSLEDLSLKSSPESAQD